MAQAPQPDERLEVIVTHDGRTEVVNDEQCREPVDAAEVVRRYRQRRSREVIAGELTASGQPESAEGRSRRW